MAMNEIIKTMIHDLGINKTMVMTGGTNAVYDNEKYSLGFKFKMCKKANYVKFEYDIAKDLYRLKFYKLTKMNLKEVATFDGLYCDMVNKTFEEFTGLYTRL